MGLFSRNKGKRGERQVATALREVVPFPEEVKRGWQTRSGTDEPDIKGVPGFWFESKVGRRPNCFGALEQAIEACQGRSIPIAVVRRDRQQPVAILRWEDFLVILGVLFRVGAKEV